MPHDIMATEEALDDFELDTPTSQNEKKSPLLGAMRKAGRALARVAKRATRKPVLAAMMAAGAVMCAPSAKAQSAPQYFELDGTGSYYVCDVTTSACPNTPALTGAVKAVFEFNPSPFAQYPGGAVGSFQYPGGSTYISTGTSYSPGPPISSPPWLTLMSITVDSQDVTNNVMYASLPPPTGTPSAIEVNYGATYPGYFLGETGNAVYYLDPSLPSVTATQLIASDPPTYTYTGLTNAGFLIQTSTLQLVSNVLTAGLSPAGTSAITYNLVISNQSGDAYTLGTQSFGVDASITSSTMLSTVPAPPSIFGKVLGDACDNVNGCKVGEPITVSTGNLFEQVSDYTSAGTNPLGFTRYYNSQQSTLNPNTLATTLGVNWRSSFDRYLNVASSSSVSVERPDGQVLNFTLQGSTWTPDTDVDYTLSQSGSTWTLKDHNDNIETYSVSGSKGVLQSIEARNGYTQNLTYTSGQLTNVSDSYGRSLNLTYSGGLLDTVSTPDGLVLTYGFGSVGTNKVLSFVKYSTSSSTQTSYQYLNSSFPFALTGVQDELGNQFSSWTYDSQGRATSSQHGSGADLTNLAYNSNGTTTVTNAFGVADTYTFATMQGVPKVTGISRAATSTTAAASRAFTYDTNGFLASSTDWDGNQTIFTNNGNGNPTSITEANGTGVARTTTIAYDPTWVRLPDTITTTGLTRAFSYDGSGNPLTMTDTDTTTNTVPYSTSGQTRETQFTWDGTGEMLSVQLPRTDVTAKTSFTYSGGALTQITDALGHQTKITTHTGGSYPTTIIDPNNVTTTVGWDTRLNLNTVTVDTSAGNLTTTYAHDAANNLISVQLPDNSKLTYGWDAAHRLTTVTDLSGNTLNYTLDALGDRTSIKAYNPYSTLTYQNTPLYDALGRQTKDTDGDGNITTYTWDANSNLSSVAPPSPSGTTTFGYDALNRLSVKTDPAIGSAPAGTTTFTYDAHNRLTNVQDANGNSTAYVRNGFGDVTQRTSPDTGTTVATYDLDRNLTQQVLNGGQTVNLTYDALDRPLTTTYPANSALNVSYLYDEPGGHGKGIGRLTTVHDVGGSVGFTYDQRGNLTFESRTVPGEGGLQTTTTYDAASRISSITYPSGTAVTYSRDSMGEVSGVTAKPPGASTASNVATTIYYQPQLYPGGTGREAAGMTFGNGITDVTYRDTADRVYFHGDTGTGSTKIQSLSYSYYNNGSVSIMTDNVNSLNTQSFSYDALDRMTGAASASGGYGTYVWVWDANSNLSAQYINGGTTTYNLATGTNQLSSIVAPFGAYTTNITNTPNGNMSVFAIGGVTQQSYTYNQANQMASATGSLGSSATYGYDFMGERIEKTVSGSPMILYQYSRAAGELLSENNLVGGQAADYIYLDPGRNSLPIAEVNPVSGAIYYLHTDKLGTVDKGTNSTQGIVWNAFYNPFGDNPVGGVSGTLATQSLRLPGQYFDPETGNNHNGFRDYAGTLTRYMQGDPIGLRGGMNTYQYAKGNPFRYTDRLGLDPTGAPFSGSGGFGNSQSGKYNLFNPNDPNSDIFNGQPSIPGVLIIGGHGNPLGIQDPNSISNPPSAFTAEDVANQILMATNPNGSPLFSPGTQIWLQSCQTGRNPDAGYLGANQPSFAQQLANILGATVWAPTQDSVFDSDVGEPLRWLVGTGGRAQPFFPAFKY